MAIYIYITVRWPEKLLEKDKGGEANPEYLHEHENLHIILPRVLV